MKPIMLCLGLALIGCSRRTAERPAPDSTLASGVGAKSGPVPPDERVRATCDSAAVLVHEALALEVKREDGDYSDSFQGTRRNGCRLTAEGAFGALRDSAGPVGAIEKGFTRRGWKGDLRYMADGPDGSDIGLRRHSGPSQHPARCRRALARAAGLVERFLRVDRSQLRLGSAPTIVKM
jgi:hypothetical protein